MNRPQFRFVALVLLVITGTALAGLDNEVTRLRVQLDLVDGAHIIGVPGIESIPFRTSYAKMDIPLRQVRVLKMDADHETAAVELVKGDRLKGVMNLETLKLETLFGKVTIGVEHIRELRISPAGQGPMEGLIAWYDFSDGAALDRSTSGNHGIIHGAKPISGLAKRESQAMVFDGRSSWIEVPSKPIYNSISEISIALWICPIDDKRTERGSYSIISKQPSGQLCDQHGPTTSNHAGLFDLEMNARNDSGPSQLGQLFFSSQVSPGMCSEGHKARMKPLQMGKWHHVAVTASRVENRFRFYVDGKKVDEVTAGQIDVGRILSQPNNEPVRIGKRKDADFDRFYFCGGMDDIRIYNRVLTDREIADVCEAGK